MSTIDEKTVWGILETVADPEIPTVSIVELGIIQAVQLGTDNAVQIKMTPTFAGCPAIHMMQENIQEALGHAGIQDVLIELVFDPPWTSDRITESGRQKMAKIGIAPPPHLHGRGDGAMIMLVENIACPFCNSSKTHLDAAFGPTLCRAIYRCDDCHQPFELFKPL